MNKAESKYFNTAVCMDEAFLTLLEKKDFEYITVKEICEKAGVNRSTFYLHYETISDLLDESVEHMNRQFLSYMKRDTQPFVERIKTCPIEELYLVTPEYLTPYLKYVREYKRLFCTALKHSSVLRLSDSYSAMFCYVFTPILERFEVPEKQRNYIVKFYIHGLIAIISEWLEKNCAAPIEEIISVIQVCVHSTGKMEDKG